jgi:hypothetical protein
LDSDSKNPQSSTSGALNQVDFNGQVGFFLCTKENSWYTTPKPNRFAIACTNTFIVSGIVLAGSVFILL